MSETIWEASGGRYKFNVGTSPDINYFSNGGSDDWVRGENLFTNFCFSKRSEQQFALTPTYVA